MRLRLLLAAALIVATGGAAVAVTVVRSSSSGDTLPLPPATGATTQAAENYLKAPWLHQPKGAPRIQTTPERSSLLFPRGTTYASAVRQLVISAIETGGPPRTARIAPALPRGIVWAPGKGAAGPRLDLRAPLSYTIPEGRIRPPSFVISGSVPPEQVAKIQQAIAGGTPAGRGAAASLRVEIPRLRACQMGPTPKAGRCPLSPPLGR